MERRRETTPGLDGDDSVNDPGPSTCCCWCTSCRGREMRENWREIDVHGLRRMIPRTSENRRRMSNVRRSVWLALMLVSSVAFVYAASECLFVFLAQAQFTQGHGDGHSLSRTRPAVTLCNLNPLRCNGGRGVPCSRTNFTEVITEKGLCYTIITNATALYLVLNAETYEYTGLGQEGVGVRLLFHGSEEHPVPTTAFAGLMLAPGLHASINVQRKHVTFVSSRESPCSGDLSYRDSLRCHLSCITRQLEQRCSCRPFWSLAKAVDSRHAWCSMKQHTSCVTTTSGELSEEASSFCSCLISCHSQEFLWDYAFSHLIPGHTSTDRGRRYHSDVIPEARLAEIADDRCVAANVAARASREISRRDVDQITELDAALLDVADQIALLQGGLQKAGGALNASLNDLRLRLRFHTNVGLRGIRRSFVSGFADRFDLIRERALTPLVAGNYETISQLERTVKQLTFTSTTETIARKVLYYMTDNQLSGKLETAIHALDNITKVYYSFLNAEPSATAKPITPDGRYDPHLLPYGLLSKTQNAMKTYYAGISENIAGLIENVLSLKAVLKDVYQSNSANETSFDQSRKTFIQRTLHVKHFTSLFQLQVVQECIDRIDSRIVDLEKINRTLSLESESVTLGVDAQLAIVSTSYAEAYNNVLAFSRLVQQFLSDADVLKSSLTNSNTDVFIQSSALTSLMEILRSLQGKSADLRLHWAALEEAVRSVWTRLLREELLRDFYLNLHNDVAELTNNPKRIEQFQELLFQSSSSSTTLHPPGSPDFAPNDLNTLLNADVAVTNFDAKMTSIREEFEGHSQQTDWSEVLGSTRVERLVRAFDELKNNLEELQKQCSISQKLIRENVIVADITFQSDDSLHRPKTNDHVYSLTSLLANVGGLLALCLGASVMTGFELIDVAVQSVCRSIRRRKSNKFADTSKHVLFRPVDILDDGVTAAAAATLRLPHAAKIPLPASIPKVKTESAAYREKQQHQAETDI